MINYEFINVILLELKNELKHQEEFIQKLKRYNTELDAAGSRILYSIDELAKTMEQNTRAIRRAMANLPMEEDLVD